MKANSDDHPGTYTSSRGKLFYNFNIVESVKAEEDGSTRTVFDYDSVEVKSKGAPDIFRGVIGSRYSPDAEIALINNNNEGSLEHVAEYQAYMDFRSYAKLMAANPESSGIYDAEAERIARIIKCSPRQMRQALTLAGLRDGVESAISAADQDLKDWWLHATSFEEDHPMVIAMGLSLGVSDIALHELFVTAVSL